MWGTAYRFSLTQRAKATGLAAIGGAEGIFTEEIHARQQGNIGNTRSLDLSKFVFLRAVFLSIRQFNPS